MIAFEFLKIGMVIVELQLESCRIIEFAFADDPEADDPDLDLEMSGGRT